MSGSPFMNRGNPKDKGSHGRRAESLVAKRLGGKLQPGSGATDKAKGDIILKGRKVSLLIENKSTVKDSFSVKLDHLLKIHREAISTGKTPSLSFQFVHPNGKSEPRMRWVCVPECFFQELMEVFNECPD